MPVTTPPAAHGSSPPCKQVSAKAAVDGELSVDPMRAYALAPGERITLIRQGLPATQVGALAASMGVPKGWLIDRLGLTRAALQRKVRDNRRLSQADSERVLGMFCLVGQVHAMVAQSGNTAGFDAAQWLGQWLRLPIPALGGRPPADYLDTIVGQRVISDLLAAAQSGAYV